MKHLLEVAAIIVWVTCILAAVVLQVMMAANTTNGRAARRVLWSLWVDGSEFTAKGLKFRDWRRLCILVGFGTPILSFVAQGIATTP